MVLARIALVELLELDATVLELVDNILELVELDWTGLADAVLDTGATVLRLAELELEGLWKVVVVLVAACVVVVLVVVTLAMLGVAALDEEEDLAIALELEETTALELEELKGLTVEALELEVLRGFVLEVELVGLGLGVPIMTVPYY